MAKFVVLDQTLTCVGGHPYELALRILQAAEQLGYEPVLAAHNRFTQGNSLPRHWRVLRVFSGTSYGRPPTYPFGMDGQPLESPTGVACERPPDHSWGQCWQVVPQWWRGHERSRYLERFASACVAVHTAIALGSGDQVFLPTASVSDLLGLARFLSATPGLSEVLWHGLFHRGFLQGREPEYAAQAVMERKMRCQFEYLAQFFPPGRLRLYGTSRKLADQFNRLSPLEFGVLPYPVDVRAFENHERDGAPRRLRLMCAGFLRREKGKALAGRFVEAIWDRELVTGRMQLVVQTNRRQARRIISRRTAVPLAFRSGVQPADAAPILWLRHPLTPPAYDDLIRRSDVALFLHDGRAYYTQCSGVLVEMLASGVPVLVPAGSWLADQISEAIYEHLDDLRTVVPVLDTCQPSSMAWRSPLATDCDGTVPTFGDATAAAECDIHVPPGTCAALIRCAWHPRTAPGTYVRVAVQQAASGSRGETPGTVAVLGSRSAAKPVSTLIPLEGNAIRIKLSLSNAYDSTPMSVRGVEVRMLSTPTNDAPSYPAGRVGLVYADVDQLPPLVQNMREHYAHYVDSARTFAVPWRAEHDVQRVVERLLPGDRVAQRAVA